VLCWIDRGELSVTELRRLQAPRENGAILAEPPLDQAGQLLADNQRTFQQPGSNFFGRLWTDFCRRAREEVLKAAKRYLAEAGEPIPSFKDTSLFLAGHQPDLFHPGVWIKNFALNGLAKAHNATALNLIVDSDAAKTLFRVPKLNSVSAKGQIDPNQVTVTTVPIGRWKPEIPYEELAVADESMFAGVAGEVVPILKEWGLRSIFESFWREAIRQGERTDLLGERLAAARRTFERRWGCHNLEIPLSRVCQTEGFAWFACHLLAHLPRFHQVYNRSLQTYRKRYHLKSRSHPVPELAAENGWLEVPFWAWRTKQTARRPLLARLQGTGIELRLDRESLALLPWTEKDSQEPAGAIEAIKAWRNLEQSGIKIRSRALMTTLYARLFLGEIFIHGIGGGKYDELTDQIIRDFYRLEPPRYLVLSGTLQLPLPSFPSQTKDCQGLARELRDLRWNPQRHLKNGAALSEPSGSTDLAKLEQLVAHRAAWMARCPDSSADRRERYHKLRELTGLLQPWMSRKEKQLQAQLEACKKEVEANKILQSREYAFCLYPEETLKPFLTQFL
jgi:hypothetical protein